MFKLNYNICSNNINVNILNYLELNTVEYAYV